MTYFHYLMQAQQKLDLMDYILCTRFIWSDDSLQQQKNQWGSLNIKLNPYLSYELIFFLDSPFHFTWRQETRHDKIPNTPWWQPLSELDDPRSPPQNDLTQSLGMDSSTPSKLRNMLFFEKHLTNYGGRRHAIDEHLFPSVLFHRTFAPFYSYIFMFFRCSVISQICYVLSNPKHGKRENLNIKNTIICFSRGSGLLKSKKAYKWKLLTFSKKYKKSFPIVR